MASFVLLLCASPLLFSHHFLPQRRSHVLRPEDASLLSKRAAAGPFRGPAHQNPAKAPPTPIPEIVDVLNEEPVESGFQISGRDHLAKRADGPLRCDDAPCIDGSCCGKNNICGYGPDYCGDGCISQCNATAMCGEFSENADMPCGMKLCCSATGPPSCAAGGGTTNGRTIGYYQSWNVRDRACNKVSPSQLNTTGYTHLFYSFASIDPGTYKITPAHSDDPAMMKDFTALSKDGKLQTWIAIGGFDFSDPGKSTHTTWSDLCSTKERRAAFIASVKEYMDTYGFQGVDIDWEYPGAPERGGRKMADTRNLATLVREMRAAYGKSYGISLTLAPDYWYLRWFDGKAMEPYVDFFGFMAYDLHGSWDADVLTLGKLVRGQADIREISSNTVPLWFDGLNPSKINFGLAMYGRGYTLADPSCNDLLCSFSGPSKPAPCTNFGGVMSLVEIKQLIKRLGTDSKIPSRSVDVPPVVTTVTDNGGLIYTRTLYLPPWPLITLGPPPSGGWSSGGSEQTTQPAGPGGGSNPAPSWPPATIPDTPWPGGEPTAPGGTEPTVWPPSWELLPVEKDVDDEGEDDDDDDGPKYTSSCKLWFFGVCIKWEGIVIGGWEWNLPTGIWAAAQHSIGPGGKPTYPPKPADCEPTQASLCLTTSSFGTTVSNGATRTTATQVKSTCATITGCNLRDVEATKTGASCAVKTEGALGRRDREWWECDDAIADGVILPRAPFIPEEIDKIRDLLKERKDVLGEDAGGFEEFTAVDLKFTAYFFVKNMGTQAHFYFNWKVDEVSTPEGSTRSWHLTSYLGQTGVLLRIRE
ncbi:oviduct-specific glycoprotein [Dactylonectria macrodidyma]|uniref:chitinase n=1 Tax=Dactylonectria macrodidyma TaxID=307937 RepID=A0A9P9IE08_9HYPO|nr:oviduct-specific glycoprotein [Dactylonectria macrodidyma]